MRILIAFILSAMSLVACGEGATPTPAATPEEAAATVAAALKQAGERECSDLTGYSPEGLKAMSAEMQAMTEREYKSCVEAVTRGETPELRGRS